MAEVVIFLLEVLFNTLWCFGLEKTENKDRSLVNYIAVFSLWGILAGGVSFYFFRNQLIQNELLQYANLFITPAIVGGIMTLLLKRKIINDENSVYAFSKGFALTFFVVLVRLMSFKSQTR